MKQCWLCGKFVAISKKETTELEVTEEFIVRGIASPVYLCKKCSFNNLERFKTYPWCKATTIV